MRDPIHLCDVVLYDGKTKKEYKLFDVVLAGNDRKKIWSDPTHRTRLLRHAFKSPASIKKQTENIHLYIKSVDFKKYVGDSNYNWGLSS